MLHFLHNAVDIFVDNCLAKPFEKASNLVPGNLQNVGENAVLELRCCPSCFMATNLAKKKHNDTVETHTLKSNHHKLSQHDLKAIDEIVRHTYVPGEAQYIP